MKTLYLTDLDGTFLNNNAEISERSTEIINQLISKGVLFTIATARTYSSVIPMFGNINLKLPLVLMNGVCIYDPVEQRTIESTALCDETGKKLVEIFERSSKLPMLYFENASGLTVEYIRLNNAAEKRYVSRRNGLFQKEFSQVDSFGIGKTGKLLFAVTLDEKEKIEQIYAEVCKLDGVSCNFYRDTYTDCYFLEVFSAGVSKLSGAVKVKKLLGCDKIVAFGDNVNDLPLIKSADESYAVKNAAQELKKAAGGIIGENTEDAVAEFLLERYNKGQIDL